MLKDYLDSYKKIRPLYKNFVDEIIFSIHQLSIDNNLQFADLKGRVKSLESVNEKIRRHEIQKPNEEIYDLAGVRIVCLFEKEMQLFAVLLEKNFEITWKQNKKEGLGTNTMGYQSLHYCIKLGNNYNGPRYNRFKGLICEVQITTVLMEAWGLINHNLVYKNEDAIPAELQRDLNNVASLLEIAQGVFNNSDDKRIEYLKDLKEKNSDKKSILNQQINYETIKLYSEEYFPEKDVSEFWQNELIQDLDKSKYKLIADINSTVEKASSFVEHYRAKNPAMFYYSTDILTKSLGYFDLDFRKRHSWSSQTLNEMESFDKNKN